MKELVTLFMRLTEDMGIEFIAFAYDKGENLFTFEMIDTYGEVQMIQLEPEHMQRMNGLNIVSEIYRQQGQGEYYVMH